MGAAGAASDPIYVDDVFSTYLYRGTNSTQSLNNGLDLSGEGRMVWLKARTGNYNSSITDTERGANNLLSPTSAGPNTAGTYAVNAFNSNGFSVTGTDAWNNSLTLITPPGHSANALGYLI